MIFLWNFAFLTQKSRHFGLGCHQKDMDLLLFENENGKILERKKTNFLSCQKFYEKKLGRRFFDGSEILYNIWPPKLFVSNDERHIHFKHKYLEICEHSSF